IEINKINKNNKINKINKIKRIIRKIIIHKTIKSKIIRNKINLIISLKLQNVLQMSKNEQKCVNKVQAEDEIKEDVSVVLVEVQQEARDAKDAVETKSSNKESVKNLYQKQ